MGQPAPLSAAPSRKRFIWLVIEPADIIELKQIVLDNDTAGACSFFHRVILPQVQRKMARFGPPASVPAAQPPTDEVHHGRIP